MDVAAFDVLIRAIYAAPDDAPAWQRLTATLRDVFAADDVHLVAFDPAGRIETDFVSNPGAGDEYRRHYAVLDTAVHRLLRAAPGQTASETDFMSAEELARCPVQNELLARNGILTRLWIRTPLADGHTYATAILRGPRRGGFGAEVRETVERLHPHLQQAMTLHRSIAAARRQERSLAAVFETLQHGIVLLDHGGRVLHANPAARRLFDNGWLRLDQGTLAGATPGATVRLRQALAPASARHGAPQAASLVLHYAGRNRSLRVRVIPMLEGGPRAAVGDARVAACVMIEDAHAGEAIDAAALRAAGFTEAEAALVAALVAGKSLSDHAAATGRSLHTARTQLRAVLAKTQTHRQSELILYALRVAGTR